MAEPNVTVCLDEAILAQILVAEMALGAFHVGDILSIGQMNYAVLRREIIFHRHPGVPLLHLYLFVSFWSHNRSSAI